jgi:hypothetical protein
MKRSMVFVCCLALSAVFPGIALSWGAVTHAYFADELGEEWGYRNLQEIYGSTLPDMFNLMYDSPYKDYLWEQTHHEFSKLSACVDGNAMRAFAYGFTSHNDTWGADYTAHHSAITAPGTGYVIAKVNAVVPLLKPQLVDLLTDAGVPDPEATADALAPGLAENFIETAVDILVRRTEDPAIGHRLVLASQVRDFRIPLCLVEAYAKDLALEFGLGRFEAISLIYGAEREYRGLMTLYGGIFTKSENVVIGLLAAQGAVLAESLLKAETGFDVSVDPALLSQFMRDVALPAVEGDYAAELAATLAYLEEEIDAHGSAGTSPLFAGKDEPESASFGTPAFYLGQNFPNPFGSVTSIEYRIPEETHVEIAVYSVDGRRVAVLRDESQPPGGHSVTWDAGALPSGVYVYSIKAGGFTETRKMVLAR